MQVSAEYKMSLGKPLCSLPHKRVAGIHGTPAAERCILSLISRKKTRRNIADEARQPSLDVLMRSRDQRWNYLGHILRMEEHRVTPQVLFQCVKPDPESLFGDVPDLDIYTAINLAINTVEWKENRPSRRC